MPDLVLAGCPPTPLLSYLKALGVMRLVAEQADHQARGAWRNERFLIVSQLTADDLVEFFITAYRPTPLVGPWAGGSGFFANDNREAVRAIAASSTARLAPYREVIATVEELLRAEGLSDKPTKSAKQRLLRLLRARLPDEAIQWLDSAFVLGEDADSAAPLLGSGGNDGRFDFSRNFLERLVDLGFHEDSVIRSKALLQAALWGERTAGLTASAVGQFDPGGAGGPNATTGMEAESVLNPWDWVLALEGAVLFAGAAARRYGAAGSSKAVFPFTVQTIAAGDNAAVEAEASGKARGEVWLPLWKRPTSLAGIRALFGEGRLSMGREQARDGVESARAVASLGAQRGIDEFVRLGLFERYGRNYLATVMGRFPVRREAAIGLLEWGGTARWLNRYRAVASDAPRHEAALRRLDCAILNLARYGGRRQAADVLASLGAAERELALGTPPGHVRGEVSCDPLPWLSPDWRTLANDGSVEFRLAVALASLGARTEAPLRAHLEAVKVEPGRPVRWATEAHTAVVRNATALRLLLGILERRLVSIGLAGLSGERSARLADVVAFLHGETDDHRLVDLLWGLSAVEPGRSAAATFGRSEHTREALVLPRAWAILKLLFHAPRPSPGNGHGRALGASLPAQAELVSEQTSVPGSAWAPEMGAGSTGAAACSLVLGQLRAGAVDLAVREATRRLRASRVVVLPGPTAGGRERSVHFSPRPQPERLAAALLFPLSDHEYDELFNLVVRASTADLTADTGATATQTYEEAQ